MTTTPEPRRFILDDGMLGTDDKKGSPGFGLPVPWFQIEDLANVFFDKSKDWIRWLHRSAPGYPDGHFVLDGEVLKPKRTRSGYRAYTLADVEKFARALHQGGRMNDKDLGEILNLIIAVAVRHKVITWEDGEIARGLYLDADGLPRTVSFADPA
jgi:hypothetical protein